MSASHHFSCLPACAHAHTCAHSHTAATCPLLHTACFFLPARAWTLSTSARSSCSWWTRPAGGRGQCVVGGWVAHWLALAGGWRLHVGSSSSPSPPSITLQTAHPGPPVHPQAPVPPLSMPPRPHSIVLPPLASQPIVAGPAHPAPLPAHPPVPLLPLPRLSQDRHPTVLPAHPQAPARPAFHSGRHRAPDHERKPHQGCEWGCGASTSEPQRVVGGGGGVGCGV